jgi:hypothetical protein
VVNLNMQTNDITVEFLFFEGCPLAPKALLHLEQAIAQLKGQMKIAINHVDLMHPSTPDSLKRWGSPTILLNGHDISGAKPGEANNCRIYSSPGGVLSAQEIAEALIRESSL